MIIRWKHAVRSGPQSLQRQFPKLREQLLIWNTHTMHFRWNSYLITQCSFIIESQDGMGIGMIGVVVNSFHGSMDMEEKYQTIA